MDDGNTDVGSPPTTTASGDPARGATAERSLRLVVVLACLLQLGLGLTWSVLQPPYRGLDEAAHVSGVLQLVYHHTWPAPTDLVVPSGVQSTLTVSPVHGTRAAVQPTPRAQRPTFAARGGAQPSSSYSQMAQHPPLAYGLDAVVIRALPFTHSWAYDQEIGLMRWVSALLLMPLPALAWATMRRFSRDSHLQVAAALTPLLLPGIARTGGSVTNDALLLLLTSGVGLCVARILTGDRSVRTGVLAGGLALLDLLTKGTALVVPAWLVLAYAWAWWRSRGTAAPLGRAAAWCAGLNVIGLLWWLRNVLAFHALQPAGGRMPEPPLNSMGTVGHFVTLFFPDLSFRFWGSLGIPEPPSLDRSLTVAATFTVLALLLIGLCRRSPVPLLIMVFGLVAILAIISEGSLARYLTYDGLNGVQGRYLYPGVTAFAVPAVLGIATLLRGRLRPLVPMTVLVFVVLLQRAGVAEAVRTTWQPIGGDWHDALRVVVAWAPFTPSVTDAMLVFAVLAAAALALAVVARTVVALGRGIRTGGAA